MDITITIRGLEELGLGLSALAAALPETARQLATLPEAARQLAALARHNGTGANNVSTAALQPLAQSLQISERPTPAQNATTAAAAAEMPPWQTDPAQEATTSATDNTPMNAASTQNKTESPRQPTLEDVRAVLAQKSAEGRSSDIHALLDRYGAKKLSAVDPARYAELLRDAEAL